MGRQSLFPSFWNRLPTCYRAWFVPYEVLALNVFGVRNAFPGEPFAEIIRGTSGAGDFLVFRGHWAGSILYEKRPTPGDLSNLFWLTTRYSTWGCLTYS